MLRVFRELIIKQNAGHAGNGACIRFVDECEFKGQRKLEKNRSPGFVLEPTVRKLYIIIAGE